MSLQGLEASTALNEAVDRPTEGGASRLRVEMYIDVSCKHIIKTDYGFCDTLRFFLRIKPKID